jgi:hypothetical protein
MDLASVSDPFIAWRLVMQVIPLLYGEYANPFHDAVRALDGTASRKGASVRLDSSRKVAQRSKHKVARRLFAAPSSSQLSSSTVHCDLTYGEVLPRSIADTVIPECAYVKPLPFQTRLGSRAPWSVRSPALQWECARAMFSTTSDPAPARSVFRLHCRAGAEAGASKPSASSCRVLGGTMSQWLRMPACGRLAQLRSRSR